MKDIYSMTVAELEAEKLRYENYIREIRRLIRLRRKEPPTEQCSG